LAADSYLIDTNILLRVFVIRDRSSPACRSAISHLGHTSTRLFVTLQNVSEFWNVCTRPIDRGGLAMSPTDTSHSLDILFTQFLLLPDTISVFEHWRELVMAYNVRGVQVHDAKLVASMLAHRVPAILTLNDSDFRRYDGIRTVRPEDISA
jgi:predicted nucleic acid-binding protein